MLRIRVASKTVISAPVTGSNLLLWSLMREGFKLEDLDCLDAPAGVPAGGLAATGGSYQTCVWSYRHRHLS